MVAVTAATKVRKDSAVLSILNGPRFGKTFCAKSPFREEKRHATPKLTHSREQQSSGEIKEQSKAKNTAVEIRPFSRA